MKNLFVAFLVLIGCITSSEVSAFQEPKEESQVVANDSSKPDADKTQDQTGNMVLQRERLRIRVRFMGAYTFDASQATLGYERQGRVGYAIVDLSGMLNSKLRYAVVINPVNETQPLPSCGEEHYFFPNIPQSFGPNVACDNNGRVRVDDYRFIALDPLMQQGPIREAYLAYNTGFFAVKAGRFILPIGFGWEEAGSFSAKDATHIQRINAEASFGVEFSLAKKLKGRDFATISASGIIGDGNKYHDYDYFYGLDGSLDSNSWPTMLLSGTLQPIVGLEFRGAIKRGHTGSKVERLPNFYASKRNDHATILSVRYRPVKNVVAFGEYASYTWGLMKTSAELLELDTAPVEKRGYYYGVDISYPLLGSKLRIGAILTREELSRDDALIKYLAEQDVYNVELGKKERSAVLRFYADIADTVRIGVFRNNLSNPYPWVSGIVPVTGPRAFESRGSDKWGVVIRYTLH